MGVRTQLLEAFAMFCLLCNSPDFVHSLLVQKKM